MSHVNPFIENPWEAVQTVIDSTKDTVERIHAGLGVLDYAAVTFIPHKHAALKAPAADMAEAEICAKLAECCEGRIVPKGAAIDSAAFPWETIVPLVVMLLKKLFPSWFS